MDFKLKASQVFYNTCFKIEKKSPEILLGLGIVTLVGAVGTAVNSTLKCESVVDAHKELIEKANTSVGLECEDGTIYSEEDLKKDTVKIYAKTGWELFKLYAPTIILTTTSIACFCGSFGIMKKRNAALALSLSAVRTAYEDYRKRVVRDLGSEMDEHFLYDTVEEVTTKEVTDENGKTKKVKEKRKVPTKKGMYDVLFDASCDDHSKNSSDAYIKLRSHLLMANNLLKYRGHMYYNRILEEFNLPETDAITAGIIYDPELPEEARFIQIRGFGTVRVARDGSLYIDESTMSPEWMDFMNNVDHDIYIRFENIYDNILDDVIRTDSEVRIIAGPKMD